MISQKTCSNCMPSWNPGTQLFLIGKGVASQSSFAKVSCSFTNCLVGGLEHFLFSHILGIIIPIDFHIFQRGSNHQPVVGEFDDMSPFGFHMF